MKRIKRSSFIATAALLGSIFAASPASAESVNITITGTDHAETAFQAKARDVARGRADGMNELSWMNANHSVKVTAGQIAKAPRIKTSYVKGRQSAVIRRQTHGAPIVVVVPGSELDNRGMYGNILGGFRWKVRDFVVLRWNAKERLYEHSHTLKRPSAVKSDERIVGYMKYKIGGKMVRVAIVKSCLNNIGGPVQEYFVNVVQVQSEASVSYYYDWYIRSDVEETLHATYVCGGATIQISAKGTAWAEDKGRVYIKASSLAAAKIKANQAVSAMATTIADVRFEAEGKASTDAHVKLELKATCDEQPVFDQPNVDVTPVACVNPGDTRTAKVTVTNPNNVDDTIVGTFNGQPLETRAIQANSQVIYSFPNLGVGTYTGLVTLQKAGKSAGFSITVEPCPVQEHQNPTAEIFVGEHAVDLYGTMPVFGRVKAFDGATATLGSPKVTPSDLGMISNWRTVGTERDGVTPCAAGYVCYEGTFRVTKSGTPGTYVYGNLVATANDSKGGSFTTQPLQFSVYYTPNIDT